MFTVLWNIKNIIKVLNLSKELWCTELNSAFSWKGVPSERSCWYVRDQVWSPIAGFFKGYYCFGQPYSNFSSQMSKWIIGHITQIPKSSYINSPWFLFIWMPFRYIAVALPIIFPALSDKAEFTISHSM